MGKDLDEQLESARTLIRQHETRVIRALFPETNGKKVEESDFAIRRGVGNPASIHYKVEDIVENARLCFSARRYSHIPSTYTAPVSQAEKAYQSYIFLRNKAGIEEVPRAVFLDNAPEWLFTEFIDGLVIGEALGLLEKQDERKTREDRTKMLERALDAIAVYQVKATKTAEAMPNEDRKELLWSRTIEEQTRNYLGIILGNEAEGRELADKLYVPLLGRVLRGTCVCHGDLSDNNMIWNEAKQKFGIFDHELKERNEFADPGSLLGYLGDYEYCQDRLAVRFKLLKTGLAATEDGVKQSGLFLKKKLDADGQKYVYYALSGNKLHYGGIRRIAKRKLEGVDYQRQVNLVFSTLDSLIVDHEKFGLSNDEQAKAAELRERMEKVIELIEEPTEKVDAVKEEVTNSTSTQ